MKKRYLVGVLVLLVFALFAASVLVSLAFGAKIYDMLSERDDASFTYRTAAQYISVKVKQTEKNENIRIEPFGQGSAIVLGSSYDGLEYTTKLYVHDGELCELFSPAKLEMQPSDGVGVLPLESLGAKIDDGMLEVELTFRDQERERLFIELFSEEAAK